MAERFVATTSRGEPVVRTNDRATAARYAELMGGQVIDMEERA